MGEPVHRLLHGRRGELAGDGAPGLDPRDQPRVRQHVEMLHDGGQRHRERPREIAHRDGVFGIEPRQQRAPRRVGEGREGAVEGGSLIVNHRVNNMGDVRGESRSLLGARHSSGAAAVEKFGIDMESAVVSELDAPEPGNSGGPSCKGFSRAAMVSGLACNMLSGPWIMCSEGIVRRPWC